MRHVLLLMLLAFPLLPLDADAQVRAIRVDGFGNWTTIEMPSANCPGTAAGSTLVVWNGYTFSGRDRTEHLTDTYCQIPVPDSLTEASYFYADETGLASLIGSNENNAVTAIRYSFLDSPRFDFDATGFQWMFVRFEAGDTDTTIVGLNGLGGVALDSTSYLSFGGIRLWDGGTNGYAGQYFCFANDTFLGEWNGSTATPSACVASARRIFHGRFE
jgi:hypothetical protein